jgi:hypothetical protein
MKTDAARRGFLRKGAQIGSLVALVATGCGGTTVVGGAGGSSGTGGAGPGGSGPNGGTCPAMTAPALDVGGRHFVLWDLSAPVATQLQLFLGIDTSEAPEVRIDLSNADRIDASGCSEDCSASEVCAAVRDECLAPSEAALDTGEASDFGPNPDPPTGYTAEARGCLEADGDDVRLRVDPFTISVDSPPVMVTDIAFDLVFTLAPDGLLESTGTGTTGEVVLGETPSGGGSGTLRGRRLDP